MRLINTCHNLKIYKDQMGVERFGLQGCRKSISPLYAEMEGLIWPMSCLQDLFCTMIHIETDFSDLVDMIGNPTDWPAFDSERGSFKCLKAGFSIFSHWPYTQDQEFACRFSHRGGEKQRSSLFPYRSDPAG